MTKNFTMKFKNLFILGLLACAMLVSPRAMAQHYALAVEPGSKGPLPEVAPLPVITEANRFGALWLESTLSSDSWASDRGHYLVHLSWYPANKFGGDHYTMQYRYGTSGEWKEWTGSDGKVSEFNENDYAKGSGSFDVTWQSTIQFRLLMHGGAMDGYVSNEVTAHTGKIFTTYGGYGSGSQNWFCVVGQEQGGSFNLSVRAWDQKLENYESYANDAGYYRFAWYRFNPNTCEMIKIEGADQETYTPTIDDAGYHLWCEISGDGEHCDFIYRHAAVEANPMVCVPVQASPDYFGEDGFVINTDYILPQPGQDLWWSRYEYNEFTQTSYEVTGAVAHRIIVRKDGQYGVRMSTDEYMYNMVMLSPELSERGYVLTFAYNHGYYDENDEYVPQLWYREAQLMADRYMAPMIIKTNFYGRPVPTTVDIYGRNLDNELVVVKSVEIEEGQTDGVTVEDLYNIGSGYLLKARDYQGWSNLTATYYPNALLWSDAETVYPNYNEDWEAFEYVIEVQPAPSFSSAGTGVIEGKVGAATAQAKPLGRILQDENTAKTYTVYLKEKGGEIVAETQTDESGQYKFENVPYGSYLVLVNIDGYTQEQPTEVTLSESKPSASGINYVVNASGTITATGSTVGLTSASKEAMQADYYGVDGRKGKTRGVNIVRMTDGTVRKVVVK